MNRPQRVIYTKKDLFHYVYDLECYIDHLESKISEFNSKQSETNLSVQMMIKEMNMLKDSMLVKKKK